MPRLKAKIAIPLLLIYILGSLFGFLMVRQAFLTFIQKPKCIHYVRDHQLWDVELLAFEDVILATGQIKTHVCMFTDIRTGVPVDIAFAKEDTPTVLDTLQLLSFLPVFLLPILILYQT